MGFFINSAEEANVKSDNWSQRTSFFFIWTVQTLTKTEKGDTLIDTITTGDSQSALALKWWMNDKKHAQNRSNISGQI